MALFKQKTDKELMEELNAERVLAKKLELQDKKARERKEKEMELKRLKAQRFSRTKTFKVAKVIVKGSEKVGKGIVTFIEKEEAKQKQMKKKKKGKKREMTQDEKNFQKMMFGEV